MSRWARRVAQTVEVLTHGRGDGLVGGGGCELGGHANLRQQRGGKQEGECVEHEGGVHAKGAGEEAAQRGAEGEHYRPSGGAESVDRAKFAAAGDVGEDGGMGGIEESAHRHLQGGKGVQEPDVAGIAHEQKGEDDSRSDQVGSDEYVFAVIAVGYDAGDGANKEWRQHAHDEERADRQPDCVRRPIRAAEATRVNQSPRRLTI